MKMLERDESQATNIATVVVVIIGRKKWFSRV